MQGENGRKVCSLRFTVDGKRRRFTAESAEDAEDFNHELHECSRINGHKNAQKAQIFFGHRGHSAAFGRNEKG
jgi:hypothetical protein